MIGSGSLRLLCTLALLQAAGSTSDLDFPCPSGLAKARVDFENLAVGSSPANLCFTAGISSEIISVNSAICMDVESGTEGTCLLASCGCPPYAQSWCDDQGALMQSEWCAETPERCSDCNGVWCDTVRPHRPMIFDATCGGGDRWQCSGQDSDLHQPAEGNVLIISEDGDAENPNDRSSGGELRFSFNTSSFMGLFQRVRLHSVRMIDIENDPATLEALRQDGTVVSKNSGTTVDGGLQTVPLDGDWDNVVMLTIALPGSGAIASLELCLGETSTSPTSTTEQSASATSAPSTTLNSAEPWTPVWEQCDDVLDFIGECSSRVYEVDCEENWLVAVSSKTKESSTCGKTYCCASSESDCCEAGAIAMAGTGGLLLLLLVGGICCGCGLCGCCPLYKVLPCSKCRLGCCIPKDAGQPVGQPTVVEAPIVVGQLVGDDAQPPPKPPQVKTESPNMV